MKAILCWRMLWERRANQLHPFLSHADIIILCLWCQKYHIWHQVGLKGHSGMPKYPTRCHNVTHGGASTHIAHHKVKEKHNLWNLKFYSIICNTPVYYGHHHFMQGSEKRTFCIVIVIVITRFSWKNLNETIRKLAVYFQFDKFSWISFTCTFKDLSGIPWFLFLDWIVKYKKRFVDISDALKKKLNDCHFKSKSCIF